MNSRIKEYAQIVYDLKINKTVWNFAKSFICFLIWWNWICIIQYVRKKCWMLFPSHEIRIKESPKCFQIDSLVQKHVVFLFFYFKIYLIRNWINPAIWLFKCFIVLYPYSVQCCFRRRPLCSLIINQENSSNYFRVSIRGSYKFQSPEIAISGAKELEEEKELNWI